MTQATTSRVTTVDHRFEVPKGGDMKDLGIAATWARQKAEELGYDTATDDWASIDSDEDGMAIVVTERVRSSL